MNVSCVLNDAMKALTTRKPIALTTTSLCSGAFTARIARTQRLHVLRVAGVAAPSWERFEQDAGAGHFKTYGLDVQTVTLLDAAAAITALADGTADVAFTDSLAAIQAHAQMAQLQFIAITGALGYGYVGLASAIDANRYTMTRLARALRKNAQATYVDVRELQTLIDRFASEKLIAATFPAQEQISTVAVMSGTL